MGEAAVALLPGDDRGQHSLPAGGTVERGLTLSSGAQGADAPDRRMWALHRRRGSEFGDGTDAPVLPGIRKGLSGQQTGPDRQSLVELLGARGATLVG